MQRMSALEFAYWREEYRHRPWGHDIDNWRMGVQASTTVNVTRTRKRDMVAPSDFYPTKPKRKPALSPNQARELARRKSKRQKP